VNVCLYNNFLVGGAWRCAVTFSEPKVLGVFGANLRSRQQNYVERSDR
jgi:hypothetical protein